VSAPVYLPLPDLQPDDGYRRRIGLLFGAALGLTYGAVSQVGNLLAVPSVPLSQAPFGPLGNAILYAVAGALLGLLVAAPRSGLQGVFLMAAAGALVTVIVSLLTSAPLRANFAVSLVAALSLTLPFWGLFVPVFAVLRWVISHQEESRRDRLPWRGRVLGPLLLSALVAWLGYAAIYPPAGRETLQRADALLSHAARTGGAPEALAGIPAYVAHIAAPYRLAWEAGDLNKYRIPRPGRAFDGHSAVVARYPDGWNLVCIYITLDEPPICRGFDALPQ
jgi:hypothetical protein